VKRSLEHQLVLNKGPLKDGFDRLALAAVQRSKTTEISADLVKTPT
jgi:hypothetical protein